jgi:hypothetical protein
MTMLHALCESRDITELVANVRENAVHINKFWADEIMQVCDEVARLRGLLETGNS